MRTRSVGLAVGLVVAAGCGPDGPTTYPVSGSLALTTGKPVPHGYITFHPDPGKGNTSKQVAIGYIKDGRYALKTGDRDGAPPGWYKVTVEAANEVDPNNPYVTEWFADEKYTSQDQSGLAVEVVPKADPGRYDFKLNPHPRAKQTEKLKAKMAAGGNNPPPPDGGKP
jgi:hypothetical protein